MKKRGNIKGHTNVVCDSLDLAQAGQSFALSGRGHGRKFRALEGSNNRAARRAKAANKRKGVS